jgi:flagellar biosynthetic protein FliR
MDPALFNWLMAFLRGGSMLVVFPVFSAAQVPVRVRIASAAFLAWFVCDPLGGPTPGSHDLLGLVGTMAVEVCVGLALGFSARLFFYALDMVGAIVTAEMGLSLQSTINPMSATPGSTVGTLLNYVAAVIWLSLDLHHWLLLGFRRAYELLPIGAAGLGTWTADEMIHRTSGTFLMALQMTGPIIAVSFIISLVFSILARAVPQMNVFTESFSVRALGILATFGLTLHIAAQHMVNYLNRLPEDFLRLAAMMAR